MLASMGQELGAPILQPFELGRIGKPDIEAGCQGIKKMNLLLPTLADKIGQPGQILTGIGLAPEHPMVKVILGPIHVGIEPGVREMPQQVAAFLRIPWCSVKPFDDTGKKIGG
jgi:hypothetical protein